MRPGDITGVTGVPELTWCYNCNKAERHNTPLKGTIAGTEGGLPFVPFVDLDKMVCVLEIDLSKESGLPRAIQEVGDARKWVTVFLRDSVEAPKVDTKLKGAILLLDE